MSQHCLTQAISLHHALQGILRPIMGVAMLVFADWWKDVCTVAVLRHAVVTQCVRHAPSARTKHRQRKRGTKRRTKLWKWTEMETRRGDEDGDWGPLLLVTSRGSREAACKPLRLKGA